MTKYDDTEVLIADAFETTNQTAAAVQLLIDDINHTATDGMSPAQTENVLARLGQLVVNQKALFASASNPLPALPPTVPPMPGPFQPN